MALLQRGAGGVLRLQKVSGRLGRWCGIDVTSNRTAAYANSLHMLQGHCSLSPSVVASTSSVQCTGSIPGLPPPAGLSSCSKGHRPSSISAAFLGAIAASFAATTATAESTQPEDQGESEAEGKLPTSLESAAKDAKHATARWRVFTDMARDLAAQGRLQEAERYLKLAIDEARLGFGEDDPHVASSYNNLAELYRLQRRFTEAEPLYLDALERLEKVYGANHINVAVALHNLGGFFLSSRKHAESAKDCFVRSIKIKADTIGREHPQYSTGVVHLAETLRALGDRKGAIEHLREVVVLAEGKLKQSVALGGGNVDRTDLKRMNRLAELLVEDGQLAEAASVQRSILSIVEESCKNGSLDAMDMAAAQENLAATLMTQGAVDEAEALLKKALDARTARLGSEHSLVARTLSLLARIALAESKAPLTSSKGRGEATGIEPVNENTKTRERLQSAGSMLEHAHSIARRDWQQAVSERTQLVEPDSGSSGGVNKPPTFTAGRRRIPLLPAAMSLAEILIAQGEVEQRMGNSQGARNLFKEALTVLDDLPPQLLAMPACQNLRGAAVARLEANRPGSEPRRPQKSASLTPDQLIAFNSRED